MISVGALYGYKRRRFESAYARADPQAVYDPMVCMPRAGFAPPRNAYDAFAYDAVWATALCLARARDDQSDLLREVGAYWRSGSGLWSAVVSDRTFCCILHNVLATSLAPGGTDHILVAPSQACPILFFFSSSMSNLCNETPDPTLWLSW